MEDLPECQGGCRCTIAAMIFIACLVLISFLTACDGSVSKQIAPQSDAEFGRTIIGTWGFESNNVAGVMIFRQNGGCSGSWSNLLRPRGWAWEGEWHITNGICIAKITKTSFWNYTNTVLTGQTDTYQILQLDEQELVIGDEGQTNKWMRKK
jgi:hypothetical protein